ncbi:: DUF3102 [Gemmata massiliana]|uniref:: DUF3102 n=1 Tax=Gemmata massiliana TaxID=1210884 RepID=A0A6P2DHS9_9BACT|nr:DUF3102 domain-containing protein [Gemmata massiliana]VTS01583.1 : DUF3102 [Gemmata massiliana]
MTTKIHAASQSPPELARPRPVNSFLATLAKRINGRESQSREGQLQHAKEQGQDLLRSKHLVGHGNWERWVQENLEIGLTQVKAYMRFAKESSVTDDLESQWETWQRVQGNTKTSEIVENAPVEQNVREPRDDDPSPGSIARADVSENRSIAKEVAKTQGKHTQEFKLLLTVETFGHFTDMANQLVKKWDVPSPHEAIYKAVETSFKAEAGGSNCE